MLCMGSATISFSFSVILSQPTTPFIIVTYAFKSYNNDIYNIAQKGLS